MGEKTVYMFPGQGSQSVGMRGRLGGLSDSQRELFIEADGILGFSLGELIDSGPEEELTRTSNAQPALLVMGVAFARGLDDRGEKADIVMGHSLGEYAALVHGGVIDFEDAVRIVRRRGELMESAVTDTPGKMAAVIGADPESLRGTMAECAEGQVLETVNFNSPSQVVISGEAAAVDRAVEEINRRGTGKALELNVAGPFHSSLMKPVAGEFEVFLRDLKFTPPRLVFIDNVTGEIEGDPERIREKLVLQLYNPVQWERSVLTARDAGAALFIESGPGSVLAGLVKRIARDRRIMQGEKLLNPS